MKKVVITLVCTILLSHVCLFAQNVENSELKNRPFQLTFVSPLGTNGLETAKINNKLSLNLFAGYNGGLSGIELGGFSNILRRDMTGLQVAGFSNVVLGKSTGCQISGFSNVNQQLTKGCQLAGFSNVVNDSAMVAQVSGFSNFVLGKTQGSQLAGFSNISMHDAIVTQLAGFSNVTVGNTKGTQVAGFTNITTKDLEGVQVSGFFNYARKLKGVQLGFINYCDSVEKGVPIGFVSVVKKGYRAFDISADETLYLQGSFITGVRQFYNIFSVGAKQTGHNMLWGWGYGMGSSIKLNEKTDMNIELVSYHINTDEWWTNNLNLLNKLKVNISYKLTDKISVYGGLSYNIFVTNQTTAEGNYIDNGIVPWKTYSKVQHDALVEMYPGLTVGIRIL